MKRTTRVRAVSLGFTDGLPLARSSLANLTRHRPEEVVMRGPRHELEYAEEACERDRIIGWVATLPIPMIVKVRMETTLLSISMATVQMPDSARSCAMVASKAL